MQSTTTFSPAWPRSLPRLGVEAHTQFVTVLVAELQSCVSRMRSASDIERETSEMNRLIRLLDAIDGPRGRGHLTPQNLPSLVIEVAQSLEVPLAVTGQWGRDDFLVNAEAVRTGFEFLFLALARTGQPAEFRVVNDGHFLIDGTADLNDPRTSWQLRCARRVLEGEGCRIRLVRTGDHCRFELRANGH